jgi:adenosylcobyric acid synthase
MRANQAVTRCLAVSRIANFDDLDPLKLEPDVDLVMVRAGEALPGDTTLVILPGSKSTRGDLAFLREQGWDIDILAHRRRGGHVLGLCGGYQMLGKSVADPEGMEGPAGETPGLGLLDVTTVMTPQKSLTRVAAVHAATNQPIDAYEIHIGRTEGADCARPFARIGGADEGAISKDGLVHGSYLHGLFTSDAFRGAFLARLGISASGEPFRGRIESALDALADHIEKHLDVEGLLELAR